MTLIAAGLFLAPRIFVIPIVHAQTQEECLNACFDKDNECDYDAHDVQCSIQLSQCKAACDAGGQPAATTQPPAPPSSGGGTGGSASSCIDKDCGNKTCNLDTGQCVACDIVKGLICDGDKTCEHGVCVAPTAAGGTTSDDAGNDATKGTQSSANNLNTTGPVDLFGILKANSLPELIAKLYTYAISLVGLAVFVQFIRAGFVYLTAAGNAGKVGDAAKLMTSAVIGAVLLFAAYLILNVINPDLVSNSFDFGSTVLNSNAPPATGGGSRGGAGGGTGDGGTGKGSPTETGGPGQAATNCGDFNRVCQKSSCPGLVNDGGRNWSALIPIVVTSGHDIPGANAVKLLDAIMRIESNGRLYSQSSQGACGLMQLLPATAQAYAAQCGINHATTCPWLKGQQPFPGENRDFVAQANICLAAEYIKQLLRTSCYKGQLRDLVAGYNGGIGCDASSTRHNALALSKACSSGSTAAQKYDTDCSGRPTVRYECLWEDSAHTKCNAGINSFAPTRDYAARFNACYYGT